MTNKKVNKKLKRNKYRIIFVGIIAILVLIIATISINRIRESEIAKYNNEILIVKGGGDQLDSLTLEEIRKIGAVKKNITLNNDLEKVDIEGVSVERILGKLNYNLSDRAAIVIEDNEGNTKRLSMSAALEPDRVYLVYKINDQPLYDLSPAYGKMAIIDTSTGESSSWFTNVKTLDIR